MTTEPVQRLEWVKLQNFRGVREGEVRGFADVNVVIGRNNAGKSTLVEAILQANPDAWRFDGADQIAGRTTEAPLRRQILDACSVPALVRSLSTLLDVEIEGLRLTPDGRMTAILPEAELDLDLDAQGDGVRAAVRCLMALNALHDTPFLIEEPEHHQHPGSLRRLASAVCVQAKAQRVQLLLTTHSLECAQAFLDGAAQAGSEGCVFHLSLTDGSLDARKLAPDTFITLRDSGLDPRFLDAYA